MNLARFLTCTAWLVLSLVATCMLARAEPQATASFECKKAVKAVEKRICSHADLALWNKNLNTVYSQANRLAANRDLLVSQQISWTRQVRDACITVLCLANAYRERIIELQQVSKASP